MASPKLLPTVTLPSLTDIQAVVGQLGQHALAEDTMIEYVFDGTNWIDVPIRKLTAAGGTPSLTLGAGSGSGATKSIEGDNVSGIISLTTGMALSANSPLFTLTLADGAAFPGNMVVHLTSIGANPLDIVNSLLLASMTSNSNTFNLRGLNVSANTNLIAASTSYKLSYIITGYKK